MSKCVGKLCPPDKLCNPRSGRCVNIDGVIGRQVRLDQARQEEVKLPAPIRPIPRAPREASPCKQVCRPEQICNPESKRCVLRRGKIGQALLERKGRSRSRSPSRSPILRVRIPRRKIRPRSRSPVPQAPPLGDFQPWRRFAPALKKIGQLQCQKLSRAKCGLSPSCYYDPDEKACRPQSALDWGYWYFESRRLWREGVSDWIADAGCEIDSFVKNVRVFREKETLSNSIIVAGTIQPTTFDSYHSNDNNIILKISYRPEDVVDNSLEVEIAIYKNIITSLVKNRHTPNVMSYLGSFSCTEPESLRFRNRTTRAQIADARRLIERKGGYDLENANVLCVERSNGQIINDWFTPDISERELLMVIFQVIYTLSCFNRIGLSHNDLHYGNIFIEDLVVPIILNYEIEADTWVELRTRYIVKIFDFDNASIIHPAVPRNLYLDQHCLSRGGMCSSQSPKYDAFQFVAILEMAYLGSLGREIQRSIMGKWILKILDRDWYLTFRREERWKLRVGERPTDAQFAPVNTLLMELLRAPWDDPPFIVKNGNAAGLPREITFKRPEKRDKRIIRWTPVTSADHEFHPSMSIRRGKVYTGVMNQIIMTWIKELEILALDRDYTASQEALIGVIGRKIPGLVRESVEWSIYKAGTTLLCFYMFHDLSPEVQRALAGKAGLAHVIDNIWNLFDNRLPIEISRVIMT